MFKLRKKEDYYIREDSMNKNYRVAKHFEHLLGLLNHEPYKLTQNAETYGLYFLQETLGFIYTFLKDTTL